MSKKNGKNTKSVAELLEELQEAKKPSKKEPVKIKATMKVKKTPKEDPIKKETKKSSKREPIKEVKEVKKEPPKKVPNDNIKTKLTRFGYIVNKILVAPEVIKKIKTDLTVKPFKMQAFAKFAKDDSFPVYVENGDYIGIPKYYGLEQFGKPVVNKIETYDYTEWKMKYKGKLRPNQEIAVNKVLKGFEEYRGGLLIAGCGSGKTNMAIWLACHFKLKTLFVVHKNFLKDQVMNRIRSTTNIQNIGVIQGKKVQTDSPFVVGMIQTLTQKNGKISDDVFKDFGLIIIDEVHHMGARNFSKFYQKVSAKYMLGISAERKRNDGLYKIINWYMGPILHQEEQKPNDMVVVKNFHYKTSNHDRMEVIINKTTKEPDRSTMISNLVFIKKRTRFIYNLVQELYDQGKNILCLTGRIKHVNILKKLLDADPTTKGNVGTYLGGTDAKELKESSTKQIILGTYDMAQEGLDIENLNVVIMCTPKSSIKQSIGRILRKEIYEEHPIVIDIIDDNDIFSKQHRTRTTYYDQQQYNIQDFYVSDYVIEKVEKKEEDDDLPVYEMYDNKKYLSDCLKLLPTEEERRNKPLRKLSYCPPINLDEIEFMDD